MPQGLREIIALAALAIVTLLVFPGARTFTKSAISFFIALPGEMWTDACREEVELVSDYHYRPHSPWIRRTLAWTISFIVGIALFLYWAI